MAEAPNIVPAAGLEDPGSWAFAGLAARTQDQAYEGSWSLRLSRATVGAQNGSATTPFSELLKVGHAYRVQCRRRLEQNNGLSGQLQIRVDPGDGVFVTLGADIASAVPSSWSLWDLGTFEATGTDGQLEARTTGTGGMGFGENRFLLDAFLVQDTEALALASYLNELRPILARRLELVPGIGTVRTEGRPLRKIETFPEFQLMFSSEEETPTPEAPISYTQKRLSYFLRAIELGEESGDERLLELLAGAEQTLEEVVTVGSGRRPWWTGLHSFIRELRARESRVIDVEEAQRQYRVAVKRIDVTIRYLRGQPFAA